MDTEKLKERYGASEHGNFAVVDTIGVPHTYMIGPKHVVHASNNCSGMLSEETMRAIPCAHPRCTLTFEQHEQALLVECKIDIHNSADDHTACPELHAYLLACKPLAEADKFAGFAFMRAGT